jgi:hypothetical protein
MSALGRYRMTMVALLAVGFAYALTQARVERPAVAPRPREAAAPRPAPSELAPLTAGDILARSAALSLTRGQRTRLEALARESKAESSRPEADLDAATAEFARFMDEARRGRGASLPEIQRRSADVRELSAALREERRRHGEAAAGVLTERQRTTLARTRTTTPGGGGR